MTEEEGEEQIKTEVQVVEPLSLTMTLSDHDYRYCSSSDDDSSVPSSPRSFEWAQDRDDGCGHACGTAFSNNGHAYYLPIRECDFPTREQWCIPGGVFAKYSDGTVGRLLHIDAYPDSPRTSIVVYAVNPATTESHPDSQHPERYVRVMKVSRNQSLSLSLSDALSAWNGPGNLAIRSILQIYQKECLCGHVQPLRQ
jgi:hypothetical protein